MTELLSHICTCIYIGFLGGSDGKESACNAGDPSLIPGLKQSPGGGHGNPLQYSCQENSMDNGACRVRHSCATNILLFHACVYMCMYVCVCFYECVCVCLHICVYSPVKLVLRWKSKQVTLATFSQTKAHGVCSLRREV